MRSKKEVDLINREISRLFDKLEARGLCACCIARGLMYRGAYRHADVTTDEYTAAMCREIAAEICAADDSAGPADSTQH